MLPLNVQCIRDMHHILPWVEGLEEFTPLPLYSVRGDHGHQSPYFPPDEQVRGDVETPRFCLVLELG